MQEILLIGLFVLVFFGAKKIPEFMKGIGKGVREFKDGVKEMKNDIDNPTPVIPAAPITAPFKAEEKVKLEDNTSV